MALRFTAPGARANKTGWGHVSAARPILVNRHLFIPITNGTASVIDASGDVLDKDALVAINDLGPAHQTWTFSCAVGRLYMHTMKEVVFLESQ